MSVPVTLRCKLAENVLTEFDLRSGDGAARAPAVLRPEELQTSAFAPPVAPPDAVPAPVPRSVQPQAPAAADEAESLDRALCGLAELALEGGKAPLTLALLGSAGSGKSFALARLLQAVDALAPGIGARVAVARVEAGAGREPASAIAASVFAALAANSSTAALAHEAAAAGADPHAAARSASERLVELRRRLDVERQALQDLTGRKARLAETVLYRAAGSRIDGWARANRARIEARLRAFGFGSADPVATYKDLVRDLSERRGLTGRFSAFLHAMWGFRAQVKLLVYAALLCLLAWGLGVAQAPGGLVDSLQGRGDALARAGALIEANKSWIDLARTGALWLAAALVALNVARAARFVSPLFRGVSLLDTDVQASQRDLDSMIANQARLVDSLSHEGEAQAQRAEEAERRVALQGSRAGATPLASSPFEEGVDAPAQQARAFLAALSREISQDASGAAPQRILVAVDDLDSLSPRDAAAFVDEAAAALGKAPFVTVLAVDPKRLLAGWGDGESWGAERLARRVQAALRIDA
ncbi:MAG: hypothetical protein JWN93_3489, partial [Hyphomicrobiales bacterium]|nr:hypothetical protein [Hyphomicrobiales bacterium]